MRDAASAELLAWYDRHARDLPWRVRPSDTRRADPYAVWLSEVMLQQTTVAAVRGYYARFLALWPDVNALAGADDGAVMAAWAGLGYYARARNLLACARAVMRDHGGRFPTTEAGLRALPGVGPYTAAAIAAIAFGAPATVVDGNVERVMARLFACRTPLPAAKPALHAFAESLTPACRPGDHAQAVMDLGATICTPRRPACGICPWMARCAARAQGIAAELPRRAVRLPKPLRHGTAFVGRRRDGAWLMERRPQSGLLGGTLGWPGTTWTPEPEPVTPPVAADWRLLPEPVNHVFTHFRLTLAVAVATLGPEAQGTFVAAVDFRATDLPTVMQKAHARALVALE